MNQTDVRNAIASQADRALRRVKQNHNSRDFEKPHLAKPSLRGAPHGPSRHSS